MPPNQRLQPTARVGDLVRSLTPQLAIVAYPTFSETDRATIKAVRSRHDPQFAMVDPHFTLLFPVEAPLADVMNEAHSAVSATPAFSVTLNSVRAVRDAFGSGGHVFLVPEQGANEITALNSRLYGGMLKWARREDIPYVPHITVAACTDFSECEALAATLAGDQRDICGSVGTLTVVEVVGARVAILANLPLAGGG
jgi:2'-5' RNA ligase